MAQHLAVTALLSCLYVYKLVWSEASVTPVKKGPQRTSWSGRSGVIKLADDLSLSHFSTANRRHYYLI